MKKYWISSIVLLSFLAGAVISCTNFRDDGIALGGVTTTVDKLSFSSSGSERSLVVTSGEVWSVTSIPSWLKIRTINSRGFSWDVTVAAEANNDYDRSGTLILRSSSSTASIAVSQDGKKGAYVPVTSVSLSPQTVEITEGDTKQLTATISPSNASVKDVSWKSSSTSIATVSSSGLVTAVSEGTATITVTTKDGSKTATSKVTVKKKAISVTGVSLDKTEIQITEGETWQLTATVSPSNATNKNVSWKSSSTSIATVSSSGLVTAVSEGTATITVTTEDGNKTATCKVTVKKKAVSVTGVSLNYTDLTMKEGETWQLSATVSPSNATNKNVSWKSSSTSVATVSSSGLVTAVSEGTATITVTTEDGSYYAICNVIVNKKTVSVTGVSLNYTGLTMKVGETWQLSATVSPSNATNKNVSWRSSSTSVASVSSSGLVTAKQAGTATITATTVDGGYTANCTVTVKSTSTTGYENGHEWVDLGLPSGLKWATCNVGASSPSDYGSYFAWGETTTKNEYTWENYRFRVTGDSWDNVTFSKYNTNNACGTVDNKTRLEMTDDAARANWGGSWRMPTDAEWTELREKCTWTWTTQGGKSGYEVTSKTNGNSIFLPAAGDRYEDSLNNAGSYGYYWSSSLNASYPYGAWNVRFNSSGVGRYYGDRYRGFSVRPVTE